MAALSTLTSVVFFAHHNKHIPGAMQLMMSILLFFFQAEDGIRDTSVTGVQTCALPIFRARWHSFAAEFCQQVLTNLNLPIPHGIHNSTIFLTNVPLEMSNSLLTKKAVRSEERRVGKECRSRRARNQ